MILSHLCAGSDLVTKTINVRRSGNQSLRAACTSCSTKQPVHHTRNQNMAHVCLNDLFDLVDGQYDQLAVYM